MMTMLAMMQAAAMVPAEAAPLKPAAAWTAEYREGDCAISRAFGPADRRVVFGFKPLPTAATGQVVMVVPDASHRGILRGKAGVRLMPGDRLFDVLWVSAPIEGDRRAIRLDLDEDFWDALPDATQAGVTIEGSPPVSVEMGPMKPVMAAAKACNDDLLRHWGADPATTLRSPPDIAPYFGPGNYPSEAQRQNRQGRVQTLTQFDGDGRPVSCRVVGTSGTLSLDQRTCSIMMTRVRVPKVDNKALPPRHMFVAVRWMIPQ